MNNNAKILKSDLVSSKKKYTTVATYTIKPSNENCTVYIVYLGAEKIDGLTVDMTFGKKFIMVRETKNHYVILGHEGKEIPLPKEDCKKTPWYI